MLSRISSLWNIKNTSDFNKNVAKVLTGSLLSQIITLGLSPILTRIYKPEDFSSLALYLSVVSILTVMSTFKYDKAIILPSNDYHALGLVALSSTIALLTSLIYFIVFIVISYNIDFFDWLVGIQEWLIYVPITICSRALYTILNTWFNRQKRYVTLSKNRVFTSGSNNLLKIVFQVTGNMGALGLILSEVISQWFSFYLFGRVFWKSNIKKLVILRRSDVVFLAKKYRAFPLWSMPADFVGIFSRELPVLMFSFYFGGTSVGLYMLTLRTVDAPFTLLSSSILEVFKQEATDEYNVNGNCNKVFLNTLKKLIIISILPFLVLFFSAPALFEWIYGSNWLEAGKYAQILSVMYFFKFISSPLSYVFYIVGKLNVDLILHLFILFISAISIYLGFWLTKDISSSLLFYSIGYSLVYVVYILYSYKLSKG
jgi:O-antigen/teichoic acid export membrane protein